MQVNLVMVGDPGPQLTHHELGIGSGTDADVVAFDRADKRFSHSVALRTFDRRRSRFKPDVASEAAGIAGNVAAAVVEQPFDRYRQAVDPAKPMLHGRHHQVAHVVAGDAARGVARKLTASRSQQSNAKATRTLSPLSQPISKPSEPAPIA